MSLTGLWAADIVVESRQTGPNKASIVNEFRRTWDLNANEVCLYAEEAYEGQPPYVSHDMGCYDIPDNDYAQRIRASLQP